eukprot:10974597-Prorocentrum_lima.AAC.1
MTSSLVGSEMCIRDSVITLGYRGLSAGSRHAPLHLTYLPSWQPLVVVAVSYTHLTLPTICSV